MTRVGNRITKKQKADIDNLPLETEDGNNDDELLNYDNSLTSDPSLKSVQKKDLKLESFEVFGLIKRLNQKNIIES